jgi:hypothetical protein
VTDPVVQPGPDDDWQQKIIADAIARGYRVSGDEPDAILLASARADLAGHPLRRLAEAMADDLQAHASQPVSRGTCAALARAAACAPYPKVGEGTARNFARAALEAAWPLLAEHAAASERAQAAFGELARAVTAGGDDIEVYQVMAAVSCFTQDWWKTHG